MRGRDEGRARSRLHRHDRHVPDSDGAARPDRRGAGERSDCL